MDKSKTQCKIITAGLIVFFIASQMCLTAIASDNTSNGVQKAAYTPSKPLGQLTQAQGKSQAVITPRAGQTLSPENPLSPPTVGEGDAAAFNLSSGTSNWSNVTMVPPPKVESTSLTIPTVTLDFSPEIKALETLRKDVSNIIEQCSDPKLDKAKSVADAVSGGIQSLVILMEQTWVAGGIPPAVVYGYRNQLEQAQKDMSAAFNNMKESLMGLQLLKTTIDMHLGEMRRMNGSKVPVEAEKSIHQNAQEVIKNLRIAFNSQKATATKARNAFIRVFRSFDRSATRFINLVQQTIRKIAARNPRSSWPPIWTAIEAQAKSIKDLLKEMPNL